MSTEAINALIAKMGEAYSNIRGLLDRASEEKRELTAEEDQQYDAWENDFDKFAEERAKLEQGLSRGSKLANMESALKQMRTKPAGLPNPGDAGEDRSKTPADKESRAAFEKYLAGGIRSLTEVEQRALQADSDPEGGYLVPQTMAAEILTALKDTTVMRQIGRVLSPLTNAESLGVPTLDTDLNDADWTPEIATATEDTALRVGKRELRPHQLSKLVKMGRRLLRLTPKAGALVNDRLQYKFGITDEKAFLTGDGIQKPLGVFTPSVDGIPTSRDVNTGNTISAIVADNLYDNLYSLKEGYQKNATWLFHRLAVKMIRKLKDTTNQYLWQPGLSGGNPATILDRPYVMSEYVPSTFTTGQYVGAVGDFSYYWIVDSLEMAVQRLDELYAPTNQVGFIGRKETDGAPVLSEAFSRITLG